jgi:hypothetical protein
VSEPAETRKRAPLMAFRIGVLAGLAVFILAAGGLYGLYRMLASDPPFDVEVDASGAVLTNVGARRLEVKSRDALVLRQVCNDACDDLVHRAKDVGETTYSVAILDKDGRCISCDVGAYIGGLHTTRLTIRDTRKPLVDVSY